MRVSKWFYVSLVIAAVMAAIIFCFRNSYESKQVNTKNALIYIDSINSIKAKADTIVLQRTISSVKYKALIQKEYEKIIVIDSLPICDIADSIAKYYKPPNR